jgi:hypothetical protein
LSIIKVNTIQNANGTTGITFAANGQMTLANTPLQLTGGQIKFPSTKINSADANVLDDYEEGTFTLSYAGGSSSPTINSQTCQYVKIGKSVTVSINIQINLGSTSTTFGTLSGFPFIFETNNATANGREWYSTGNAIEVVGSIASTDATLAFYNNSTSLSGITIIGIGVTFSYITSA